MAKNYQEVIAAHPLQVIPAFGDFAKAARKSIRNDYQRTFGLGELVAKRREELNFSQMQLSEETGVSQADISRFERGLGNPTVITLQKILAALHLQITLQSDEHPSKRRAT
ncbi:MAG: helix-turn-helix transcriptional regulator [Actinomycetes bacterium]